MFDVGDIVPLGIATTNADGQPANATTVVLTIGLPDGTTETPTVANPETGQYTVDYVATMEGRHTIRWVATGANSSAYGDTFNVRELGDQLISLAEAKTQLGASTAQHEEDLRLFIAASGRAIENHICRTVVRRIFTEQHRGVSGKVLLNRIPAVSVTSVASLDGTTTWDAADLNLDADIGLVTTLSGAGLSGNLTVTYVAGMRVVPPNILLAARIITEHLWQTRRGITAGREFSGTYGDSLDVVSTGGLQGFAIPNRALELLGKPPPVVA